MRWSTRFVKRQSRYDDLKISIQEHIAERTEELIEDGLSQAEAEQKARLEFGNVALIEQRSRETWQWRALEDILFDVRFALRQLVTAPCFSAIAIITLALGIAVNASMFSLVSAFLLPRLPGRQPQSIVVVSSVNPDGSAQGDTNPVSAPNYFAWSTDKKVFSEMSAVNDGLSGSLSETGKPTEAVDYGAVTSNYFSVFGASAELGRTFQQGEDQQGHERVAVLGHALWTRRYNSNPSIVGHSIRLNRKDYLIVGVMPANFRLVGFTPQLWTPLTLTAADTAPEARKHRFLYLFARLGPGVTLKQAKAQMQIFAQQAQTDFPQTESRWGASVRTLPNFLVHNFGIGTALTLIMTVVGFVLLIACANVAGLLLTRSIRRQKELAIRISLGATRARVVRQLLTEGIVIALTGGGLGVCLTWVGVRAVRAGLSFSIATSAVPIGVDKNVVLFALVISLGSAVLSSVAPAWKASRVDINTDLKNEARGGTSGRSTNRLRSVLVGGEIALAVFLLIGSFLLIRAAYLLDHQPLGFKPDHLLSADLVLDQQRYSDETKQVQFIDSVLRQVGQIPSVEQVVATSNLPSSGPGSLSFRIKGQQTAQVNEQYTAADAAVTAGYFRTIGIPTLTGRTFTEADNATAPRVVVVNQEFVRRYLGRQEPLGRQIQLEGPGTAGVWSEIVGVVGNVRNYSEDTQMSPQVYEAYAQRPVPAVALLLRSNVDMDSLATSIRHTVQQLDAELPVRRVISMEGVIDAQRNGNPLFEKLLTIFAALALILASIGTYGLISYSVSQRKQEIGIRLAVGANLTNILRMILWEGLKIAAFGSVIGLVIALPLPRLFEAIFSGLTLSDTAAVYPLVLVGMLCVILCSTLIPAWRGARIDPTTALRSN